MRIFHDEGVLMLSLLHQLRQHSDDERRVEWVPEVWQTEPSEANKSDSPQERLTPREHDVLGVLAAKGTNAELADALFLETNTVKPPPKSPYSKLGLHNRGEAVQQAHVLGLL